MRRYEFKEGTSSKFWEIELEGESFTTRFGKIGTQGQASTKDFDSPAQARAAYDKLVAEKEKKGYKLVSADDGAAAASNAELEAAILANPEDASAYLVYGDWLQSQGDPRGELIAVQAALLKKPNDAKLKQNEKDLFAEHVNHLLGDLMEMDNADEELAFEWYLGFLKAVSIGGDEYGEIDAEGALRTVLKLPSARFLRELRIGVFDTEDGQPDYSSFLKTMAKMGLPQTLRRLNFDIGSFQISWSTLGNLSILYPQLAELEELRIKNGKIDFGKIVLPNLRLFEVVTGGFTKGNMASVASASWPKLESLTIYFGDENYGGNCSVDDLKPILDAKGLGKLKHLGLCNAEFQDDIARAVPKAKITKQLETLDLSKGTMTDEGADALAAGAASLAHLKRIDVSENFISEEAGKRLKKALPKVEIGTQGDSDGDYRYVQVAE